MRKFVVSLVVVALSVVGFAGVASGAPGPNGHNDYGLCKAYFSGSENGQNHKHKAKPFVALQTAAGDQDGDGDTDSDDVAQYCADKTPGGKGGSTSSSSTSATRIARL